MLAILLAAEGFGSADCLCDCNGDGAARIDEVTTAVDIALGRMEVGTCPSSDYGSDGNVGIVDLIGCVDAAIHGCPPVSEPTPTPSDQRAELERNRQLWDHGARVPSHQYILMRGCFCQGPHRIDVRVVNGELQEILDPETGDPIENLDPYFPVTIDDLFDLLDGAIGRADVVDVDYDPTWGAPVRISIDYLLPAVDDEISFVLSDLRSYDGGHCRQSSDCDRLGSQCIEPGGFIGCGICDKGKDECAVDDDCGGGNLCRRQAKFSCLPCDGGTIHTCRPGCVLDEECRDGEVCGDDGHCSVVHCLTEAECNMHFDCNLPEDARTGICERRTCNEDADCSDGFCVNGKCYDRLGQCEIIPP